MRYKNESNRQSGALFPERKGGGYPVFLNVMSIFRLTKWIGGSGDEDGTEVKNGDFRLYSRVLHDRLRLRGKRPSQSSNGTAALPLRTLVSGTSCVATGCYYLL